MNGAPIRRNVLGFFLLILACTAPRADPSVPPVSDGAIPQPRVVPGIIHPPVVEGGGLNVRRLSTADGLSQTRVAHIAQDDRGFMWFGTQYGLDRFDGYEFKVYAHDRRNANSLAGAYVSALFKDRLGALWIGCNQFLDRFDPRTETFTHMGRFSGAVVHISQDPNGTLWIATEGGLYNLDPLTHKSIHFAPRPDNPAGLSGVVTWTGYDRGGEFWVGTSEGLDKFDPATGRVTYHVPIGEGVPYRQGMSVSFLEDQQGLFWIAYDYGNGLALLDRQSNTLTRYSFYREDPPPAAATGVMGILEDNDGNLWLGSLGIGLLRFDRDRRMFVHYGNRPGDPQSIAEDKIIALFQDREGNIWTGLHSKGPNVLGRSPRTFEIFKHDVSNPKSLGIDFVNAIYEDLGGSLWIGNDQGLHKMDRTTGSRVSDWSMGLGPKPTVVTITQDQSGYMWIGTYGHGLVAFDPKTGHFKVYRHIPSDPKSLSSNAVYRLLVDRSRALWIGTEDGLNRYDAASDNFTVYKQDWSSTDAQIYLAIAEDPQGRLWLGTHHSGLHRFDPTTGQFTVYRSEPNDKNSLPGDSVTTVLVSRAGVVWAGTENGLARFDPKSDHFTSYDAIDGLPGNTIACILGDKGGNLWLSTNRGLSRYDPSARTFTNYSEMDGLPGNDLSGWNTCYESSRGEMFFGGFPGAFAFYPDRLKGPSGLPNVVLTDFKLAGNNVPIAADSPLTQSITYTDRIVLSHAQNLLSITYAGLDYLSPQTARYRYRLEGLERKWNEVGSDQRHATYTTLPAGRYTFRVEAARSRGKWNEPGAALAIEILPPWWETWWFRSMMGLLLASTAWVFYRLRIRQLSHQLTIRMQERLGERMRIAQDLHDTLLQGLIGASLQLQAADRHLGGDATAKPLVRRVSQVLEQLAEESRHTVRGLRTRYSKEEHLERALTQLSKDLAAPHKVTYQVAVEGKRRPLRALVWDEVFRIGGEALANAFRHARASAVVTSLDYGRDYFRMVVQDDGKGIDPEDLKERRDGHFGLLGLQERAAKIGAELKIRTVPGAGTEIELIVPAKAAFERSGREGSKSWLRRRYLRSDRE